MRAPPRSRNFEGRCRFDSRTRSRASKSGPGPGEGVMVSITANGLQPVRAAKPWYRVLYIQVLLAILLGIIVGWLFPEFAKNDCIKALGDGFIKLIKMVIAPIIFCTVVSGIAHIDDAKKVGRVGIKALVYFEVVSTFA